MSMGIVVGRFRRLRVLANRIHGSTRGLSTPADAGEKITSIQRSLIYVSLSGVVIPMFLAKR